VDGVISISWEFMFRTYALCILLLLIGSSSTATPPAIETQGYQIVHTYPHDPRAFTQGLLYVDGHLYEGTGLNGRSSIRMVDLTTGRVLQKYDLPSDCFGEGLTDWGSTLVELTWQAHRGFVYDRFTFSLLKTFTYEGEGWGLTHDGKQLIMSDGTSYLRFLDPKSFRETHRIHVTGANGQEILDLNELEYVRGEIYANIWHSDRIARISPKTGKVLGWIDLTELIDKQQLSDGDAVLNGIAYDAKDNRLFVTGKLWPKLFEIRVTSQR
jgi:glutaminyl-peptide cyclotransferase